MGFGFIKTEKIQPTQLGFSLILAGVWQKFKEKCVRKKSEETNKVTNGGELPHCLKKLSEIK